MGFSRLRVLNEDRVRPGAGFGTHGHRDMEIVTYVLGGVLEHADSMGNGYQLRNGDVQRMSAGSGVTHSEYNPSQEEELHLLQMWVLPAEQGTTPGYEEKDFPAEGRRGALRLVVSPDGREGSLTIGQDASLFAGLLDGDERVRHAVAADRSAWLHVARGGLDLNGERLEAGDGAAIRGEPELLLERGDRAELVLWDLPL